MLALASVLGLIFAAPAYDSELGDLDLMQLIEMDLETESTSTGKRMAISESPSIVSVISEEQIREFGYRTVAEALGSMPGVYVRNDLIHPNVSLRGIDAGLRSWNRHLKVMINGQPVAYRSDNANWLGEELVPMAAISRIEFIRGPGSTLYGANAFFGVVNIITKEGQWDDWVHVSTGAGLSLSACPKANESVTLDSKKVNVCDLASTAVGPQTNLSVTTGHIFDVSDHAKVDFFVAASLGFSDRSGRILPATSPHFSDTGERYFQGDIDDVISSNDTSIPGSAYGYVRYTHQDYGEFRLESNYQQFSRGGEFTDWGVLTHENQIGMRNGYLRLLHKRQLNNLPIDYEVDAAISSGGQTADNRLQIAKDNSFWVRKTGSYVGFDISTKLRYNFSESNSISTGVKVTSDYHDLPSIYSVSKDPSLGEFPSALRGSVDFQNVGVFLQGMYEPTATLHTIVAASYDQHSVYTNACSTKTCDGLNARLGLVYTPIRSKTRTFYSKLLYGSSFKAPSAELLYGGPYVTSGITGNEGLSAQKAHTLEGALGADLADGTVKLHLNGFYNRIHDKVEYLQDGIFTRAVNSADVYSYGFEAVVKARLQRELEGYINLSWQSGGVLRCLLSDADRCAQLREFNYLFPELLANAGLTYSWKSQNTKVSLSGTYVGKRWASQSNRLESIPSNNGSGIDSKAYAIPQNFLLNLSLLKRQARLINDHDTTFALTVNNLLNQATIEPGFNGIDIPGQGLTVMFTTEQGF